MTATERALGIGGSEAAAAVGVDPYRSRVQLWLEKTNRVEPPDESEAMYWGAILEQTVREEFEHRTGTRVLPGLDQIVFPLPPFMRGTPDGQVELDNRRGIFEAKTTSGFSRDWDDDGTPTRYVIQVQHYMALTGLSFAVIACLIGGQRFVTRRIERDDELIAKLIEAEAVFWRHVTEDEPPEPDGSESAEKMLRVLYPEGKGAVIATAEDAELVRGYRKLKRAAEAAQRQADEAEQTIKARIGDHQALVWQGRELARWTRFSAARFDSTAFRESHPDLWERWKRDVQSQRFTVSRERGE